MLFRIILLVLVSFENKIVFKFVFYHLILFSIAKIEYSNSPINLWKCASIIFKCLTSAFMLYWCNYIQIKGKQLHF